MKIDLSFRTQGSTLPADHAYLLFSALCRALPHLHSEVAGEETGFFSINGTLIGNRKISVTDNSRLVLRLAAEQVGQYIGLAGAKLGIGPDIILLGVPEIYPLPPHEQLSSRLVSIKNGVSPGVFLVSAKEKLTKLGVTSGDLKFLYPRYESRMENPLEPHRRTKNEPIRRTVVIAEQVIVGFALEITDLSPEDSIRVQESGIGGRRHFGCGLFRAKRAGL